MSPQSLKRANGHHSTSWRVRMAEALRPLMWHLPRGYGLIYRALGGRDEKRWATVPDYQRVFYDPDIQAYIYADVRQWSGRLHYYLGRYYDITHQLLQRRLLHRGDTYVDIGANIGIHSLLASRLVGDDGQVLSFEPNPLCQQILQAHLAVNGVRNCRLFPIALSDVEGELTLSAPDDTPAMLNWSLRQVDGAKSGIAVPVRLGDAVIPREEIRGGLLIKIDTEGVEHSVLRGLVKLLEHPRAHVCVEVTPRWLEQCGTSALALMSDMRTLGFAAYLPSTSTDLFGRAHLRLERLTGPRNERQYDVLFSRDDLSSLGSGERS